MRTRLFLLSALVLGAAISCTNPQEENIDSSAAVVRVNFHLDGLSKAGFEDATGIVWEAGDAIRFEGNTGQVEATVSADDISADGYTAALNIAIPNVVNENVRGVFRYNWSTRNIVEWDFGSLTHKVNDEGATFTDNGELKYVQSQAGVMNKAFLFMHSGTSWSVDIPKAEATPVDINVKMNIVGSILRFIPYTETYNVESVQKVTFSLNSAQNLGGTVVYDYVNGNYRDANQVNWLRNKRTTVELGTPFSLAGVTSREAGKGIYMPVPATNTPLEGYKIVVTTDVASYTFSTSAQLNVGENIVKNVFLKLENAERQDLTAVKGDLQYAGGIGDNSTWNYSAEAVNNDGISYWFAQTRNTGETAWVVQEANVPDNAAYYNVSFVSTDDATAGPAAWCRVSYRPNDTWWVISLDANTSSETRSATVVATFPSFVEGYVLSSGFKTRTIHIVQSGVVNIEPVIEGLSSATVGADGGTVTATLNLKVGGVDATDEQFNQYIGDVTLTAENASVTRNGRTLTIKLSKNPFTTGRTATVTAAWKSNSSAVQVTQQAAATAAVTHFTYGFSAWQDGNKNITLNFSSDAQTGRGDWIAVFANVAKDGVRYTGEIPDADKIAFIKEVMWLSDSEYAAMDSWLDFVVQGGPGEVFLKLTGFTQNTTGAPRKFEADIYNAGYASVKTHLVINQNN